jgi:hypothetical protein
MTIDVEVSRPPMFPAPHGVGKFAQRVEIVCGEQRYTVIE